MFGDINKAEIIGNITQDLELRHTGKGTAVVSFGVATNRNYQVDGEWREDTEFHNVVVWGSRAERLVERAKKGTRVFIEGRLSTSSWEDSESGSKKYKTEIVASRLILLDRYERGPSDSLNNSTGKDSKSKSAPKNKAKSASKKDNESIDPDDLPF